jgi:hypothetical protein
MQRQQRSFTRSAFSTHKIRLALRKGCALRAFVEIAQRLKSGKTPDARFLSLEWFVSSSFDAPTNASKRATPTVLEGGQHDQEMSNGDAIE